MYNGLKGMVQACLNIFFGESHGHILSTGENQVIINPWKR
jgi:hypothetical protein